MPLAQVANAVGDAQVEYDQRGAGPHLLLLHSLLTEMTVFDLVLPRLMEKHRVTRINLPGFGASSPVVLNSVADHADHVARVMDALKLPTDTTVFGNGFGAFVALELAIRHGSRFGKLIVADCLAAFPEPARAPFRVMADKVSSSGMHAVLDTAIGRMFPPAFAQAHPGVIADRKKKLAAVDARCFGRACMGLASLDLSNTARTIKNRTLVMCGALDQTTPPALARELAEKIAAARYEDISNSGHCPIVEQPETLIKGVLNFCEASGG